MARRCWKQPSANLVDIEENKSANSDEGNGPASLLVPNPSQAWPTGIIEKSIEQSFGVHQFAWCRIARFWCQLVHAGNSTTLRSLEIPL
jgi:hypothetical protein